MNEQQIPGVAPDVLEKFRQEKITKQEQDIQTIDSLEEMSFFSWGYTEPLKVTHGSDVKLVRLKIKSVGVSSVIEEYQHSMPKAPAIMKTYKPDSEVARSLNQRRPIVVWEVNEADPEFLRMKQEHETRASQMILLLGLAMDLKDGNDIVLKGRDVDKPSVVVDKERALKRLQEIGFSSEHFGQIVRSIRELTKAADQQEDLE